MIREILDRIIRRIKAYDSKESRVIDFFLQGDVPDAKQIDDALEADYRRKPELWIDPSIVWWYTGKDLLEEPTWEPGARGFMERIFLPAVISLILIISIGLIWGIMNRAGA